MTLWSGLTRLFVAPPAQLRSNGTKKSFPERLSQSVIDEIYRLDETGFTQEDIGEELGISEKSVGRYLKARRSRAEMRPAVAPSLSAEVEKLAEAAIALGRLTDVLGKGGGGQTVVLERGGGDTADDIEEEIRLEVMRELRNSTEYKEIIRQRLLQELGGSTTRKQTAAERFMERVEERVMEEMLNGRQQDNEDDGDWRSMLKELGRDVIRPMLKSAFPGPEDQERRRERRREIAAPTEPNPASQTEPSPEAGPRAEAPPRLLGAFTPSDLERIFTEDDPVAAAEKAWDILEDWLENADMPTRARVFAELNGFLVTPGGWLRALMESKAQDHPAFASAITTLLGKREGWVDEFRGEIQAIMNEPEDEERTGEGNAADDD